MYNYALVPAKWSLLCMLNQPRCDELKKNNNNHDKMNPLSIETIKV